MYTRYLILSFWLVLSVICVSVQFYVMRCVLHYEQSKSENCQSLNSFLFSKDLSWSSNDLVVEVDLQEKEYHFQQVLKNHTTYKLRLPPNRNNIRYSCQDCIPFSDKNKDTNKSEFLVQVKQIPFDLQIYSFDASTNQVIRIQHLHFDS